MQDVCWDEMFLSVHTVVLSRLSVKADQGRGPPMLLGWCETDRVECLHSIVGNSLPNLIPSVSVDLEPYPYRFIFQIPNHTRCCKSQWKKVPPLPFCSWKKTKNWKLNSLPLFLSCLSTLPSSFHPSCVEINCSAPHRLIHHWTNGLWASLKARNCHNSDADCRCTYVITCIFFFIVTSFTFTLTKQYML